MPDKSDKCLTLKFMMVLIAESAILIRKNKKNVRQIRGTPIVLQMGNCNFINKICILVKFTNVKDKPTGKPTWPLNTMRQHLALPPVNQFETNFSLRHKGFCKWGPTLSK